MPRWNQFVAVTLFVGTINIKAALGMTKVISHHLEMQMPNLPKERISPIIAIHRYKHQQDAFISDMNNDTKSIDGRAYIKQKINCSSFKESSLNRFNKWGLTMFLVVAKYELWDEIEEFLQIEETNKNRVNMSMVPDSMITTPIHAVVLSNKPKLVNLALNRREGVSIDLVNHRENTPLMHFLLNTSREKLKTPNSVAIKIIRLLLEAGASPNHKNKSGISPLDWAKEQNLKIVLAVLEPFAKPRLGESINAFFGQVANSIFFLDNGFS